MRSAAYSRRHSPSPSGRVVSAPALGAFRDPVRQRGDAHPRGRHLQQQQRIVDLF
ncbi:hypothetical protein O0544_07100 [Edwardsiella anguillarum]|nr:hypothetical protein [Edwardsiella anguillarum]